MSRDKGQAVLFGARDELEAEHEDLVYGLPRNQHELTDRVITALADRAAATADNANDRPTLVDLGLARQMSADAAGERSRDRERHEESIHKIKQLKWEAEWHERPHAKLTDLELARAIGDADRASARASAAAEEGRALLAQREQAVAAERGPRVTELDVELERLRSNARLQSTLEGIDQRREEAVTRAAQAAGRASRNEYAAERTPWWQSGKREQLLTEAAAERAQSERAIADAQNLGSRATELQQVLGGTEVWKMARQRAERAEANYPRDREQALREDSHDVVRLQHGIARQVSAATIASEQHARLQAEQELRAAMPAPQRDFEVSQREQWNLEQQHEYQSLEAQHSSEIHHDRDLALGHAYTPSIEPQIERDSPEVGL